MKPATIATDQTKSDLSLYQIEQELLWLMDQREIADTEEEKQAADLAIQRYAQAELRKVDNIVAYLRHCANMAAAAAKETERIGAIGRRWLRRQERLENATLYAMQTAGVQKLEGSLGSFTIRKNPPSVDPEIDMDLLPLKYAKVTVTMPGLFCASVLGALYECGAMDLYGELANLAQRTPCKTELAADLKKMEPCSCVAGMVYGPEGAGSPCEECGGRGRVPARIAGARLIVDKVRLEVK